MQPHSIHCLYPRTSSKRFTYYYPRQACSVHPLLNSSVEHTPGYMSQGKHHSIAFSVDCQVLIYSWVNWSTFWVRILLRDACDAPSHPRTLSYKDSFFGRSSNFQLRGWGWGGGVGWTTEQARVIRRVIQIFMYDKLRLASTLHTCVVQVSPIMLVLVYDCISWYSMVLLLKDTLQNRYSSRKHTHFW